MVGMRAGGYEELGSDKWAAARQQKMIRDETLSQGETGLLWTTRRDGGECNGKSHPTTQL